MRLFVDKLTHIDFSFLHPARGLVGETWQTSVVLHGDLDDQGMVVDFGDVKKRIKRWLDEAVDHRLLVPQQSSCLSLNADDSGYDFSWQYADNIIHSTCPTQALTIIEDEVITCDSVARWCMEKLLPEFPSSVKHIELQFTPEHIDGPYYHYSHGLKKHGGNCQRIAHGHRSRILIWRDGTLSKEDMQAWAQRWQDIYIGTQEDCARAKNTNNQGFRYTSQQGTFYLEVPRNQCYLIDTDSTIEFIAQHIAQSLKQAHPASTFVVKAFEGIEKGAIAES